MTSTSLCKLEDYCVLDYLITHVDLTVDLTKQPFQSEVILTVCANPQVALRQKDLILDGEQLTLTQLSINGGPLEASHYSITPKALIIKDIPLQSPFIIEMTANLGQSMDLFGLYETEGILLVKAETEGLRRVFYCHDRPDNLATYRTTVKAPFSQYPVLLANGRLIDVGDLSDGAHYTIWQDDLPKPSYLFALVAGNLERSTALFTRRSGKSLPLEFYLPADALPLATLAKETLIKALAWDESRGNLECDLEHYMVAGVNKYASGASEPTGLNLFNTANLLASEASTTDLTMMRVIEVVSHEFFHYWSGNRVTIRDWFNLSLKEGLTTLRAALFREELLGTAVVRLLDGQHLDPLAPRPNTYSAVRSLYTKAAYGKSADIFRMIMLTLGEEPFYRALTQFFRKFDGQAATLEDLLILLGHATGTDVLNYLPWFTESGIIKVDVSDAYYPDSQNYRLTVTSKDTKGRPFPLTIGLIDDQGTEILPSTHLIIDEPYKEFSFNNLESCPVPSLLRNYSAPVELCFSYSRDSLLHLIQYDSDMINRCVWAKKLFSQLINDYCENNTLSLEDRFFTVFQKVINEAFLPSQLWLQAEILTIPSEEEQIELFPSCDFAKITKAREIIYRLLAKGLEKDLRQLDEKILSYVEATSPFTEFNMVDAGRRRLQATISYYLMYINKAHTELRAKSQFLSSLGRNMTETLSSLTILLAINSTHSEELLAVYYNYWQHNPTSLNYWFSMQASQHATQVVSKVKQLLNHKDFDRSNPNKVYALLLPFIKNPYGFHALSGDGYELLTHEILIQDKLNPPVASRLAQSFIIWGLYNKERQSLMLTQLKFLCKHASSIQVKSVLERINYS